VWNLTPLPISGEDVKASTDGWKEALCGLTIGSNSAILNPSNPRGEGVVSNDALDNAEVERSWSASSVYF